VSTTALNTLLEMAESQRDRLMERIAALPREERATLADKARQAADAFAEQGDAARAEGGFRLAMALYQTLEAWPQTIEASVRCADVMKFRADTVEQYEMARLLALGMMGTARHLRQADLVFSAYRVAADSAYFAAALLEEQRDFKAMEEWLLNATRDCVAALEVYEVGVGMNVGVPFLSLLAGLTGKLRQHAWFDEHDAEVREALRRIALCAESLIPTDLALDDPGRTSMLADTLARLSYSVGSPDNARERLSGSIERARAAGDLPGYMWGSSARYRGERESYRPADALHALRAEFWDRVDEFRLPSRSRAGRLWTAQQLDEMTGTMITDAYAGLVGRDIDEAFRAVEVNRARTLLDEFSAVTRDLPDGAVAAEARELEAQVLHLEATAGPDDAVAHETRLVSRLPIGGLQGDLERLTRLERLEQLYAEHDAGFLGQGAIDELGDVIDALQEGEAVVEYHIPYDALDPAGVVLVLLIMCEGALALHLPLLHSDKPGFIGRIEADGKQPLDASPLAELIVAARIGIQSGDDESAAADLESLYKVLVEPLANYGVSPAQFTRLVIVPHGILHAVPFAALKAPGGRHLIEDVALVLAPSASIWRCLQARPAAAPTSLLGFADPALPAPHEPLPDARDELRDIASFLSTAEVVWHAGEEATEALLRRDAPGKGILHFATHGEFPEADVMNMHRLLLAPADGHDGKVHAEEIRGMDLAAAQLAVLSICDGGLYRFGPGDEPYGLISALLAAGVTNVVAPVWSIDDRLGRRLIVEFYRRLMEHGPAEALRQASVVALRGGAAIRDWAGFVLVGPGRRT
jgi:hypothetical protein